MQRFHLARNMTGVCLEVSTYGRCPPRGGVHLGEVSTYGEMSTLARFPTTGGAHLWEVSN